MKSQKLPTSACLYCKTKLNAATSMGSASKVHPGAITICIACGHVMAFDGNLQLRELTGEEMIMIAGNKRILEVQRARAAARVAYLRNKRAKAGKVK